MYAAECCACHHARQHFARNLRQQRSRQNVIHIARSALDFGTAPHDFRNEFFRIRERHTMVLFKAFSDLPQFELDDPPQRLIIDGVVRNHDQTPQQRGLEDFAQLRIQRFGQRRGLRPCIRIGAQFHDQI